MMICIFYFDNWAYLDLEG